MISCILTVIKNEHEYLDEWIKYHLDLGINHIFIFEDIDSESDNKITDKYTDKVTLNSILSILINEEQNIAYSLKKVKKWNVQHLYFKKGLLWIKQMNKDKYDWCFVIDNDEFITLEYSNTNINEILSLYNKYDAFIMWWKCYGANGHINKPNYSNHGLIETYTSEITGKLSNKPDAMIKTCYNINLYDNEFFYNQHHPKYICNWCNTNYIKDINNSVYDKIYIRHYITKSWEEFVWKKQIRGCMWGGKKGVEAFFEINTDLKDQQEELINNLNENLHIYSNKK